MGRKKRTRLNWTTNTLPSGPLTGIEPAIKKCRHYDTQVTFPNDVTVWPTSRIDRTEADEAPDLGLYLESSWRPTGLALMVDWPDYAEPRHLEAAFLSINHAYDYAVQGHWVEISCHGGHGRTGTALACMAVIGGISPDEAIAWVRGNYCHLAIETPRQEWYVTWFAARTWGEELPPRPEKLARGSRKKKDSTTTVESSQQVVAWNL